MNRPAGVTAAAVVAMIGSVFTLLLAAVMVASAFMEGAQPPNSLGAAIGMAAFLVVLAVLGISTSVGLVRLRPWARTSIVVFAGIMTTMCLLSLAFVALIPFPMPAGADPSIARMMRPMFTAMNGVPLLIGIWWVIQFNTRSTKSAFASASPAVESRRPLSVSIIGWLMLAGAASCALTAVAGTPAFLAGLVLTGWRAMVVYAVFGLAGIYIGRGLLMLRERARVLALAWFALSAAHMAFVTLVPRARAQMLALQRSIGGGEVQPLPFDYATFWTFMLAFVVVVAAAAIWFLVRNRGAFQRQPAV